MIQRPLGSKLAARSEPSCPASTVTRRFSAVAQSRAVPSSDAVTTLVPSGLNPAA